MDTLKKNRSLSVKCLGCGSEILIVMVPASYMISQPEVVCSEECANRHEVHLYAHLEKQAKDDFVD